MLADIDLDSLVLERGRHSYPEQGLSILEAVSVIAPNEKFGDAPRTVSPVIASFLRDWNDSLDDAPRQELKPYIPKVIGSVLSEDVEELRAWQCTDWLVRVQAPIWLRAAGLEEFAEAIENQEPVVTPDNARAAQQALDSAAEVANAAARDGARQWKANGEAAWARIGPKAWDSAGNGVKLAVKNAARPAAAPALAAAGYGRRYAARDAAAEVASDVGWDAAFMVAWSAALPVGGFESGAASNAARESLAPTVEALHQANFSLLDLLIGTRRVPDELKSVDYTGQERRSMGG